MNKLNRESSTVEYLKLAKNIICYQQGRFTLNEIMKVMLSKCENDVDEEFLKPIIIHALFHLNEIGIIHHKCGLLYEANESFCQI